MELAQNPKIAATAGSATTAIGASTYYGLVAAILGIVASIFGITLTSILIYYAVTKNRLELKILREKDRLQRKEREAKGAPSHRCTDK
jgi:hypothetical protein